MKHCDCLHLRCSLTLLCFLLCRRDDERKKAAEATAAASSDGGLVATNLMSKLDEGANESDNESTKENGRPPKGVTMVEDKAEPPKRRRGKRDKIPPKELIHDVGGAGRIFGLYRGGLFSSRRNV